MFAYNRLGKIATVADAAGTRTFAYDPDELDLQSESIDGSSGGLYSKLITRKYDTTAGVIGRSTGFRVGTSNDPAADYEMTYGYDGQGRLEKIFGPGLDSTNGVKYDRLTNSELVEYARFKSSGDADLATIQRVPVGNRDLLDYVENKAGATTVSKYDYTLDTLGRRKAVVLEGTAFSSNHHWDYGYNGRSELVGGNRRTGTDPGQGTDFSPNGVFDYTYDPIGNRTESNVDHASPAMSYTANNVNQYTATANPNESLAYDADGNLTADGRYAYSWDAENRLVLIVPTAPAGGDAKLEFKYDYKSRRVEKEYSTY
ncbi:MAG TPA: hypothetical protein VLM89_06775, partial [Phycisphaerae bacterium]|nr:hypothetical protein [Phycisphaerae bacterium]